jgi:hypothetical protein
MSDERLARIEQTQIEIKTTLARLEPMILKIMEGQARVEGTILGMASAAEVAELRGRVEEISRRQSVTLAYQPPEPRRTGGGG